MATESRRSELVAAVAAVAASSLPAPADEPSPRTRARARRPRQRETAERLQLGEFNLGDLEAIRLILQGGSVIDWYRLHFESLADVERFLRVNELYLDRPGDRMRLQELRRQSVEYLQHNFRFKIPAELCTMPVPDLFLCASKAKGRRQMYACIVLKVMHIIHHLEARELLFRLPISDEEVFHLVEGKLLRVIEELRADGFPVVEFAWSRKRRDSYITKLLAKRETIAAQVFDKLRFRVVVRRMTDVLPTLRALTYRAIPFNYAIPGQSVNELIHVARVLESRPDLAERLQSGIGLPDDQPSAQNEFSGREYRVLNFVADLPVRIEGFVDAAHAHLLQELGPIVFVLAEFQLLDQATATRNRRGEASHRAYKQRQKQRVKERLTAGMTGLGSRRKPEK